MKKLIFGLFLTISVTTLNAFRIPTDRDGVKVQDVEEVGVSVLQVRYTQEPQLVLGSSIAVYGVLTSTRGLILGASVAVELRSTNTANLTSELLIPPLDFSSTTRNTFYEFNPPLICPDGLSANLTSGTHFAAVFYRFLATNTAEDFFTPYDRDGVKAHSSSFYGVKVASEVVSGGAANTLGTEGLDYTSDELLVENERGFLYGIIAGTGAATNFVVFEDTASTLGNTADFLPPLFYNTFTTESYLASASRNAVIRFPWPLIFTNGLSQARNVASDRFRVLTRPARSLR